jgi:hypothetical protein
MATTSVLGAVEDYIATQLAADPTLAGIPISRSAPDANEREEIFFYDAQLSSDIPVSRAGRAHRDELGQILVAVNAAKPGQAGPTARDRALVLFAAIENVVANDLTLAYLVTWCRLSGPTSVGVDAGGEGWDGLIRTVVEYSARLT